MTDECCKKSFFESAKDTARRLLEDPSIAPKSVQDARMEICKACDKNEWGRCTECGCFLIAKVKPNNMKCPLDKWLENT